MPPERRGSADLVAYCFAPLEPAPDCAEAVAAHVDARWQAAARLGMSDPLPGCGAPLDHPAWPASETWFGVLAARQRPDGSAAAVLALKHDAVCVLTRIATIGSEWAALTGEWEEVAPDPATGLLGEALLFSAGRLPRGAWDHLGRVAGGSRASRFEFEAADGTRLLEVEGSGNRRVLALIARSARDHLAFYDGDRDLPPVARYLLHAAKIRYEVGVYQEGITDLRRRQAEVEAEVEELFRLHGRGDASLADLLQAQAELSRAQGDATGLFISQTRLRDLARTVAIAEHNLRAVVPPAASTQPDGESPYQRDLSVATWLCDQIDHDLAYLDTVRARAQEAQSLTALRLEQAGESRSRRQHRLTILQTSILGALLAGLAAIEALGAPFEIGDRVRGPLIVAVMAAAFALPPLAMGAVERYGRFEYAAAAALGAGVGWLVAALAWPDSGGAAVAAATGGAVAAPLAAAFVARALRGAKK